MDILLEKNLPHQQEAVEGILNAIGNPYMVPAPNRYANPTFPEDYDFSNGVRKVQEEYNLPFELRENSVNSDFLNIDVKMETGTGKTYVYTDTIFELNRQYGFNKFVIVVPSLSVKAVAVNFLNDPYVTKHFRDECGFNKDIFLNVAQKKSSSKKGRSPFPEAVRNFYQSPAKNTNQIQVLIVNSQLLNAKSFKDEYDSAPNGKYCPLDAIKATHPVVIMDEPHRFSRNQTYYKQIRERLEPELLIRFGATFPDDKKNKKSGKDYENLVYDLNAREAFSRGLVKSIAKEHFGSRSKDNKRIRLKEAVRNDHAVFELLQEGKSPRKFQIHPKESMGIIDESMSGIRAEEIKRNQVKFNNDVELNVGESLTADIYMRSYQENMIDLALRRHFETERELFNRKRKIKTLALFFIDDIDSYRGDENGDKYLNDMFERILRDRLREEISQVEAIQDKEGTDYSEYIDYLKASLDDLSATHAGYFARDRGTSDEIIAEEVKEILEDKKGLLSIRKEDGSFNTRRFLFSKWTLREGWDQPNVFTICKLRSSGSEILKLQEVGRGMRLPVNELGNRVTGEDFTLNYIVDFNEADFAKKLVDEINGQLYVSTKLSDSDLKRLAESKGINANTLTIQLYNQGFIDEDMNIVEANRDAFAEKFPEIGKPFNDKNKVRDRNKDKDKRLKIRREIYDELKELWEQINQRFILFYSKEVDSIIEQVPLQILKERDIFTVRSEETHREKLDSSGSWITAVSGGGMEVGYANELPYNEFLKRINRATNLPISLLHKAVVEYSRENPDEKLKFTQNAVANFIQAFRKWEIDNLEGLYHYKKSASNSGETALTDSLGNPKEDIAQFRIGVMSEEGEVSDNYLYDALVFDSDMEKDNISKDIILDDIDQIYVFGKIPNRSISIPTITSENYSPDFMYVVKRRNGDTELNLVVETKGKEESGLSGIEDAKIRSARQFFKDLSKEGFKVHFKAQTSAKNVRDIILEILDKEKQDKTEEAEADK